MRSELRAHFSIFYFLIFYETPFQCYFEDLPPRLREIFSAQLRQAEDISAVVETPDGFLLYLAKEKTDTDPTTATLSLPKRQYEQWLSEHNGETP